MHTKVKYLYLTLLIILSFVSFCYLNFSAAQVEEIVNFADAIPADSHGFDSMLPELELIEWLIKRISPVTH